MLGAVLLTLFLVAQACMAAAADPDGQPGASGSPSASPSVVPAASPGPVSPSSGPPATAAGQPEGAGTGAPTGGEQIPDGARCTDAEMLITAEATPATAPAGSVIRFTIRIRSDAERSCVRDVGPGQREIYLRRGSGADRVWSSRDCVELSGSDQQELPTSYDATHYVDWNGRDSATCDGPQPAGEQLGPGEYELVARLGTVYSEPVTVTLT